MKNKNIKTNTWYKLKYENTCYVYIKDIRKFYRFDKLCYAFYGCLINLNKNDNLTFRYTDSTNGSYYNRWHRLLLDKKLVKYLNAILENQIFK